MTKPKPSNASCDDSAIWAALSQWLNPLESQLVMHHAITRYRDSFLIAGANVTTGVPSGMAILFSLPLYETVTVRPSTSLTASATVALVMLLLGFRSQPKLPSSV